MATPTDDVAASFERRIAELRAWAQHRQHMEAQMSPAQRAAEGLKEYWTTGPGGARIGWGTEGDMTRCHDLVSRAAGVASTSFDVWGYCQSLHIRVLGHPNPRD